MAMLNNQMVNVFFPAIHVTDYQRAPLQSTKELQNLMGNIFKLRVPHTSFRKHQGTGTLPPLRYTLMRISVLQGLFSSYLYIIFNQTYPIYYSWLLVYSWYLISHQLSPPIQLALARISASTVWFTMDTVSSCLTKASVRSWWRLFVACFFLVWQWWKTHQLVLKKTSVLYWQPQIWEYISCII